MAKVERQVMNSNDKLSIKEKLQYNFYLFRICRLAFASHQSLIHTLNWVLPTLLTLQSFAGLLRSKPPCVHGGLPCYCA